VSTAHDYGTGIPTGSGDAHHQVELTIYGMTCASCAARIEKKLNRLPGVHARVNFATEKARVSYAGAVTLGDLKTTVAHAGYSAQLLADQAASSHAAHDSAELRSLRERLLGSAVLAVQVIAMSMAQMVPGLPVPDNAERLSLLLTAPVVAWGAWPFHRAAWRNLRHGAATMDTLVSMGVVTAFLWSCYAWFVTDGGFVTTHGGIGPGDHVHSPVYFEVAAGVTVFLLAGRYFEARAKRRAGAALRALLDLGAPDAAVLRDGQEMRVSVDSLMVGDEFVVRPGEKFAADGEVLEGASVVDASMLTGESIPVEVGPGGLVTGGTVNLSGRLRVRASRVGADTRLAHMARLVADAQNGKAKVQRLADRISAVFVPVVILLAMATLSVWLAAGAAVGTAFAAAVAVLIIACPCALGLATPTALLVGTGRGAQLGILIKGPEVLESTRRVDTVLLDKTGTITTGTMALVDVLPATGEDVDDVLRRAAAVEDFSEHPVGAAVAAGARQRLVDLPAVTGFRSVHGRGVQGVVNGTTVVVGQPAWLAERWSLLMPGMLHAAAAQWRVKGYTVIAVAWDGRIRGLLTVADSVKPTSAEAVRMLRGLGLTPVLLTGDNEAVARCVAAEVGIDTVIAGVLPEEKVEQVSRLQRQGRVVAMVGDGLNDAAALAQADLGLAMGTGTDAAIEASDLTLVRGDLRLAADAIRLSRRTLGFRLQHSRAALGRNRCAQPHDRRSRDGIVVGVRGIEQPSATRFPSAYPVGGVSSAYPIMAP
jgi:Cu+-exporting ATPase